MHLTLKIESEFNYNISKKLKCNDIELLYSVVLMRAKDYFSESFVSIVLFLFFPSYFSYSSEVLIEMVKRSLTIKRKFNIVLKKINAKQ